MLLSGEKKAKSKSKFVFGFATCSQWLKRKRIFAIFETLHFERLSESTFENRARSDSRLSPLV